MEGEREKRVEKECKKEKKKRAVHEIERREKEEEGQFGLRISVKGTRQ